MDEKLDNNSRAGIVVISNEEVNYIDPSLVLLAAAGGGATFMNNGREINPDYLVLPQNNGGFDVLRLERIKDKVEGVKIAHISETLIQQVQDGISVIIGEEEDSYNVLGILTAQAFVTKAFVSPIIHGFPQLEERKPNGPDDKVLLLEQPSNDIVFQY